MIGHGCMIGGDAAAGKGVQIIGRVPIIGERRVVDVTDGLIHRWRLTENANDAVGTLHLTNNNSVTFSANGASFNGSNQALTGAKTWPATFTVSAWIKYSTYSTNYAFGAADAAGTYGFGIFIASDVFLSVRGGTLKLYSGRDLADSEWHLIGVGGHASGASEWTFYVDGALEGSGKPVSFALDTNFALGRLGAYESYYFAGHEIDARIYSQALTSAQHTALYANGPNP